MVSFEHKELLKSISVLGKRPVDDAHFKNWLSGIPQIKFLQHNVESDDIVMYAAGGCFYTETAITPLEEIQNVDVEDLLDWSGAVWDSRASIVAGGGRNDAWLETDTGVSGCKGLKTTLPLVYGRSFEGLEGPDATYYEVLQEYTHFQGIHWRPEQHAYCRFDDNGDFLPAVSITKKSQNFEEVTLVSFNWDLLDKYLSAGRFALLRMFDFTCVDGDGFPGWSNGAGEVVRSSDTLAFRRKVDNDQFSYICGVQIIYPRISPVVLADDLWGRSKPEGEQYVSFIANDWRNKKVLEISTDPSATTNYFEAQDNDLPFELSPAFFRADVLSKYRQDKAKYGVGERDVTCRGAWYLKGIDINDANQVHAYICDLRNLPFQEQLYWKSFNEKPKSGLSERAMKSDFLNQWSTTSNPLRDVLKICDDWERSRAGWWRITDDQLTRNIAVPHTGSRDEWAEAFMDLSKLVVEGFKTKFIRTWLKEKSIGFNLQEQSIALLEKAVSAHSGADRRLAGLRTIQQIRSKVKGHSGSSSAKQIETGALKDHETFANHFQNVCAMVHDELKEIEAVLK